MVIALATYFCVLITAYLFLLLLLPLPSPPFLQSPSLPVPFTDSARSSLPDCVVQAGRRWAGLSQHPATSISSFSTLTFISPNAPAPCPMLLFIFHPSYFIFLPVSLSLSLSVTKSPIVTRSHCPSLSPAREVWLRQTFSQSPRLCIYSYLRATIGSNLAALTAGI